MSRRLTAETHRRYLKEKRGRADLLTNYLYSTTLKRYAELVDMIDKAKSEEERVRICRAADMSLQNLIEIEERNNA